MIKNLDANDVARLLEQDAIILIDVREPDEYAAAHIKGARLFPLSAFDPGELPAGGKPLVMQCGSGMRSARAVAACQKAGLAVDSHLKGGIQAWVAAGFPVERK